VKKIKLVMFASPTGHDVARATDKIISWMNESNAFEVTLAGTLGNAALSIEEFMLDQKKVEETDAFFMNCGTKEWMNPKAKIALENAVASGKGVVAYHGVHPEFNGWEAFERMAGLMWRYDAKHGDYNDIHVRIDIKDHPIMKGLEDFDTREELYCNLQDLWGVDFQVLATAFSDYNLLSRHGQHGTGRHEPVATVGSYGKGRTFNFLLGHIWSYYTGHGIGENTFLSFEPPAFRKMLLRGCEWVASGEVKMTL
jgi:type 1 glutamine amidotransferase